MRQTVIRFLVALLWTMAIPWAVPAAPPAATAAQDAGPGPAGNLQVDHERSSIVAVTGKEGLLGFAGHRHAVLATGWSARITYDPERPGETRVDVSIPVSGLEIDSSRALEAAGLDPEGGPSDEDVRTIAGRMVGSSFLAGDEHPEITFRTRAARHAQAYDRLVIGGPLTIRGRSNPANVALTVEPREDGYRVRGEFDVKMTDYGMEPESVAGVVEVADDVAIRLDIRVRRGRGRSPVGSEALRAAAS